MSTYLVTIERDNKTSYECTNIDIESDNETSSAEKVIKDKNKRLKNKFKLVSVNKISWF